MMKGKKILSFIPFILCLPSLLTQPYTLYQTIILPEETKSWGVDISDDNQTLVASCEDKNTYVYHKRDSGYEEVQKLTESTYIVYDVDITGDGQWLIASGSNKFNSTHHNATIFTYRKDNQTNRFQYYQSIQSENLQSPSGAITDDHQWIVMGEYWNPAGIKIYKFNQEDDSFNLHQNFTFNQSIKFVNAIDITNDHQFLAICTDISVFVYRYNKTSDQFQVYQEIDLPDWDYIRKIFLTDDHKYLTVSETDSKKDAYLYQFNDTTKEFQLQINYTALNYLEYLSLSEDEEWLCFSIKNETKFVNFYDQNESYTIQKGSYYHKFSSDSTILVSSSSSNKIYIFAKQNTQIDYTLIILYSVIGFLFVVACIILTSCYVLKKKKEKQIEKRQYERESFKEKEPIPRPIRRHSSKNRNPIEIIIP